ncbi:hypothetical protein HZF24_04495 [Sedimentibacter hydroxybenzoicus DSM 7310]|uniref:Uncharacterized protein n=1 Tax=Sedimentibacter hydroxybenzoicus DSM 7310 TaxID=1123245 RepID=A0A974BHS0_SEDHY|nr:hypothetical protein [Sedimentibacter hydroxybenzoicus]NYB73395.1 hypothetical protein [Sedimentibacter hydroxybenzoicus DSM 7310]
MYDVLIQILNKLNANTALKALVQKISAFGVFDVNNMYYKATKLTSDGVKAQIRLEMTAICDSYQNSINAITETEKTLLTIGDNKLTGDILSVVRNGGVSMKNNETQTYHETGIFIITYKERIR